MKYGLIGRKLSHSFSKEIHSMIASYDYELCEIEPNDLESFITKKDFCAINVTIPYKNAVIPFLDNVSSTAMELGSVNTIVNKNGVLYGYNTDYLGMKEMIIRSKISLAGKKVLILGTGATSRTSSLVAKNLGASEILLVSRTKKENCITYQEAYKNHTNAQIIINATPIGMFPNSYSSPINISKFNLLEGVFDAVYNPIRTSMVLDALESKIYGESGLYMLVSQAIHASMLFSGENIPLEKIEDVYKVILTQKENIVLAGMPSCGKTTVGKILASNFNREFVDLDDEIEKHLGCTIAQFFENHSESEFREIESEITEKVSKRCNIIISTGGGCVMKPQNVRALRSNGRIYFIDRSIENLIPTDSRPLARRKDDIEKLYNKRYEIYKNVCDAHINGNFDPNEVANLIGEEFYR